MKKFFALMAVVLAVVSCQKDVDNLDVNMGGDVATISVTLPADAITRAVGGTDSSLGGLANTAGETIRVILKIYDEYGNPSDERQVNYLTEGNLTTNFDVRLIPNRDYTFVAWADKVDGEADVDKFYNTTDLKNVTLMPNTWDAMNEGRDAFTGKVLVEEFNSGKTIPTLVLTRPLAKLRVVTNDMEALGFWKFNPTKATVSYTTPHYAGFNAYEGKAINRTNENVEHQNYTIHTYTNEDGKNVKTIFSDYFFAAEAQETIQFNITVVDDTKNITLREVAFNTDIPVKRNNLTTIAGNILTDGNDIDVNINPDFDNGSNWNPDEDEYDVDIWDGKTTKMPEHNGTNPDDISGATEVYVEKGSELAWLADLVNGGITRAGGNNLKGITIVLNENINLNNEPWTPIGSEGAPFCGTFNGNGKTIANLVVNGYDSNAGLFGFTTDGEIKNLVIENAKVSGRLNVGVVAGTPYTSKYTDITIKGHVEVNGMAYVGGVGGKNAYANWENITVNVDKTSYVKAHSIENGTAYRSYVGGVVGFNGEGGHSFKNIISNINVEGSTCDVGGLFGIAHYGNQFENCSCYGNVKIYAAEEAAEAEEIGGIAGVWNNADNTSVTMTNVVFTGEIFTNIERNTVWYGNLVGKYYKENDLGELTLNGLKFTRNGADFSIINDILTREAYTMPFDLTGNAKASNGYGATGINHANYTLDGGNHTLKVSAVGTWGSAIATKGGTIKNITIAKGFRGIFVNKGTEPVILENVIIDGTTYTISCDTASNQGLTATNSTFNGWTSYAATIGEVYFKDCSFGYGAGYKFARPYAPTTFVNCDFCEGYEIDPRAKVTFINCRVNGVTLTSANYTTLVTSNESNAEFTTEDGKPLVADATSLNKALENGNEVVLAGDIAVAKNDAGSNGYGATGISQLNGGTIDGNSNNISVNAWGTWDSAINTTGGTIKNLNVTGGMRGIFVNHNGTYSEKVILDNVTIDGTVYTISCDQGKKQGLEATNSTFKGWTSYAATIGDVKFTNCNFGKGQGYALCRPYAPTEFVGCAFEAGFELEAVAKVTFENCTIGGVALTAENLATLVTYNIANASVK